MMKKTYKSKIRGLNKSQFERLKELCHHAKNLYNQGLYQVRQMFFNTGKYLDYCTLDKLMKTVPNLEGELNYRFLKAGVSQQILRRLDKNFRAFFKALKVYETDPEKFSGRPRIPNYVEKDLSNFIYDDQRFQIEKGYAHLEKNVSIKLPQALLGKRILQIEIKPQYGYFEAIFVYEDDTVYEQIERNDNVMAIDLGLDNLATCTTNGIVKPFAIDGKKLKSINQYYNKKKAAIQSELKQTRNKDWSNQLQTLTDKRNHKVNDYLHKASRKVVDICVERKISTVIIGNVSGAANGIHLGKRTNQNFVNISLGQLGKKLKYKLEAHGIEVRFTDEHYTSKASFVDGDELAKSDTFSGKRITRGLYRSRDGTLVNADVNGGYNLLRKSKPEFSFAHLVSKLEDGIEGWLHPHSRLLIN